MKKAGMLVLLGGMVLMLFGCGNKMHKVDYCGQQGFYEDAKEAYKEGEKVTLRYNLIATDTDYAFYLDDEPVSVQYENEAYVIRFVMPNHDVKLDCQTTNSMENMDMPVTILNQIKPANIWIIPDTEANRKTTVWGTATVSNLEVGTSEVAYIPISDETDGLYQIRMIDEDEMFYSAEGVKLEPNQLIVIREDLENVTVIMEIYDAQGTKLSEDEMLFARL